MENPVRADRHGLASNMLTESTGPFTMSIEQLSDNDVAELAFDPSVAHTTPIMPTKLIKSIDGKSNSGEDNWGVSAVAADASPYSGSGVTVAVLDTGIDKNHPSFSEVDVLPKDFSGSGNDDRNGHGTHCAGIIFGRDVGARIGVARGVGRALIGKVLSDDGTGQSEAIFEALIWAMNEGADVVSLSIGFDFPGMVSQLHQEGWPIDLATSTALDAYRKNSGMFEAIMQVLQAQQAFGTSPIVIAAAGNESRREIDAQYRIAASLPAAATGVISVAAIAQGAHGYKVSDFSNCLATVSAPGVDISSAAPGGGLKSKSGTSMAAPHVAGVASLLVEYLRKAGLKPNSSKLIAHIIGNARRDVFSPGAEEVDIGCGLVTAP